MKVVAVLCGVALGLGPAAARTGRCVLTVNHKTYLNGPCEIGIVDDKGSFTIGVGDKSRSTYFAYVTVDDDGAHGAWNATPDSNHADAQLGLMKRRGACWESNIARVCAYK